MEEVSDNSALRNPPRSYPIQREKKWKYSFLSASIGYNNSRNPEGTPFLECSQQIPPNPLTQEEIFSKSYYIKPKSDCIYDCPIDLEQQTNTVRLLFQINGKMVNKI